MVTTRKKERKNYSVVHAQMKERLETRLTRNKIYADRKKSKKRRSKAKAKREKEEAIEKSLRDRWTNEKHLQFKKTLVALEEHEYVPKEKLEAVCASHSFPLSKILAFEECESKSDLMNELNELVNEAMEEVEFSKETNVFDLFVRLQRVIEIPEETEGRKKRRRRNQALVLRRGMESMAENNMNMVIEMCEQHNVDPESLCDIDEENMNFPIRFLMNLSPFITSAERQLARKDAEMRKESEKLKRKKDYEKKKAAAPKKPKRVVVQKRKLKPTRISHRYDPNTLEPQDNDQSYYNQFTGRLIDAGDMIVEPGRFAILGKFNCNNTYHDHVAVIGERDFDKYFELVGGKLRRKNDFYGNVYRFYEGDLQSKYNDNPAIQILDKTVAAYLTVPVEERLLPEPEAEYVNNQTQNDIRILSVEGQNVKFTCLSGPSIGTSTEMLARTFIESHTCMRLPGESSEDSDDEDIGIVTVREPDSEEDDDQIRNLCTECGVDMGINNPRQLCGKTICYGLGNGGFSDEEFPAGTLREDGSAVMCSW